jgi:ubiquilin
MLSQMERMMSDPAMGAAMRSMMTDPRMMESMMNSDPRVRAMLDANPEARARLTDPAFLRQMADPANLRAMMQMQQAMQQLQSSGLAAGFPGGGAGGFGGDPAATGNPFATFGAGAANASNEPPETLYASQLQQLKDMGFFDEAQNIRALQATMGNVSAAIERLLGGA